RSASLSGTKERERFRRASRRHAGSVNRGHTAHRAEIDETAEDAKIAGTRNIALRPSRSLRFHLRRSPKSPIHEFRSITAGFILSARREGIQVASAPMTATIATGTAKAGQSGS